MMSDPDSSQTQSQKAAKRGRPPKPPVNGDDSAFIAQLMQSINRPEVIKLIQSVLQPKLEDAIHLKIIKLEEEVEMLKAKLVSFTAGKEPVSELQTKEQQTAHHAPPYPRQSHQPFPQQPPPQGNPTQSQPLSLVEVHRELEEKRKRASNVVVHGLAPKEGVSDDNLFCQFMEDNLKLKPHFKRDKCRRLGKKVANKIQPLHITFTSTIAAADILASAGALRKSHPTVFLNPDLTPAEARLAYEDRVKRRERKMRHGQSDDSNMKNATTDTSNNDCSTLIPNNSNNGITASTTPIATHPPPSTKSAIPRLVYTHNHSTTGDVFAKSTLSPVRSSTANNANVEICALADPLL